MWRLMSALHFHTEDTTAHVWGGEWSWLDGLAKKTSLGFLNPQHNHETLRPLIRDGHELRDGYQTGLGCVVTWASWFGTSWRVDGDRFIEWRGRPLSCSRISLNTAAAVGGEAFRFAIRLAGQGDIHCWIDGPDRAWAADLIDEGLEVGYLRRQPAPSNPVDIGWGGVADLLRASDDGAVVCSYSVEGGFPSPKAAGFKPPMPDGWRPDGWSEREWAGIDYQNEYWDEHVWELWGEFGKAEQWQRALDGLKARPAANLQIQPGGGRFHFGPNLTVFDLLADDRDTRIEAAFADYDAALADGRAEKDEDG